MYIHVQYRTMKYRYVHIYVYMHTPGLLSMQLHMFAGDAAKGIGWMTGAQDFSIGRLREEKKLMA